MLVTVSYFHPSLIFSSEAERLPLEISYIRGFTVVSSILVCKYKTRIKVADSDEHSSLLRYGNKYDSKKVL